LLPNVTTGLCPVGRSDQVVMRSLCPAEARRTFCSVISNPGDFACFENLSGGSCACQHCGGAMDEAGQVLQRCQYWDEHRH
jgi:hypothetical protein